MGTSCPQTRIYLNYGTSVCLCLSHSVCAVEDGGSSGARTHTHTHGEKPSRTLTSSSPKPGPLPLPGSPAPPVPPAIFHHCPARRSPVNIDLLLQIPRGCGFSPTILPPPYPVSHPLHALSLSSICLQSCGQPPACLPFPPTYLISSLSNICYGSAPTCMWPVAPVHFAKAARIPKRIL